jgi:hypothetical protein
VATNEVRIRRDQQTLWRIPQAGRDSLLLFLTTDSAPGHGTWAALAISSVSGSSCAGHPALRLGTDIDASRLTGLPLIVPVRTFEIMQLRLYRSQGDWWLGARSESAGEAIQPVTGPFSPRGLRLTYYDSAGQEVADPALVRQVELRLFPARPGDSARVKVQPRNLR